MFHQLPAERHGRALAAVREMALVGSDLVDGQAEKIQFDDGRRQCRGVEHRRSDPGNPLRFLGAIAARLLPRQLEPPRLADDGVARLARQLAEFARRPGCPKFRDEVGQLI